LRCFAYLGALITSGALLTLGALLT